MKITVMGLGKFGGGIGAAKFFAEHGADVTVTDLKSTNQLAASIAELEGHKIKYVLGRHRIENFRDTDMVVVNPAVPRKSRYIKAARIAGPILRTEIGLFVERCPAPICGITGSNGKSTVVSMLQSILSFSGCKFLIGGNIGGSLLSDIDSITPEHIVVLELSSFQLEWLNEMKWSPHLAAILNVLPNHLDRHGSYENYLNAKAVILDHQKSLDKAVLVRDDPGCRSITDRARCHVTWVGTDQNMGGIIIKDGEIAERIGIKITPLFDLSHLRVHGSHNVINAMVATACAREMSIDIHAIHRGLESFHGLPNRLELVGENKGVKFYNDSKATTPEAVVAAVRTFDNTVIPIMGGYDKRCSFKKMARCIADNVTWAALIGVTAPKLSHALKNAGVASVIFDSIEEAFKACVSRAHKGDIVLLSPGCASYDMFNDYEERGERFRALVNEYSYSRS